jgi:hypothetical protein
MSATLITAMVVAFSAEPRFGADNNQEHVITFNPRPTVVELVEEKKEPIKIAIATTASTLEVVDDVSIESETENMSMAPKRPIEDLLVQAKEPEKKKKKKKRVIAKNQDCKKEGV